MRGLWALALVLAGGVAARGDDVVLRRDARATGPGITLADVAELRGEEARAQAGLVVARAADGRARVTIEDVRRALRSAGANRGRINLTGSACEVRVGDAGGGTGGRGAERAVPDEFVGSEVVPGSVGEAVRDQLAGLLGVAAADLRVGFDAGHAEFLGMRSAGRSVVVRPAGSGERATLGVRVYEGDRLLGAEMVRASVRQRREVAVARVRVERGRVLTGEDVTMSSCWVPMGLDAVAGVRAVGSKVRRTIEAGRVVEGGDVDAPFVVRRGDPLSVECLAGSVSVRMSARALEPGREGQVIEARPDLGGASLRVTVTGAGTALVRAPGRVREAGRDSASGETPEALPAFVSR